MNPMKPMLGSRQPNRSTVTLLVLATVLVTMTTVWAYQGNTANTQVPVPDSGPWLPSEGTPTVSNKHCEQSLQPCCPEQGGVCNQRTMNWPGGVVTESFKIEARRGIGTCFGFASHVCRTYSIVYCCRHMAYYDANCQEEAFQWWYGFGPACDPDEAP